MTQEELRDVTETLKEHVVRQAEQLRYYALEVIERVAREMQGSEVRPPPAPKSKQKWVLQAVDELLFEEGGGI